VILIRFAKNEDNSQKTGKLITLLVNESHIRMQ